MPSFESVTPSLALAVLSATTVAKNSNLGPCLASLYVMEHSKVFQSCTVASVVFV